MLIRQEQQFEALWNIYGGDATQLPWNMPQRPVVPIKIIPDPIAPIIIKSNTFLNNPPQTPPAQSGNAPQVTSVSISQEPIKVQAKTMSYITVTFTPNPSDTNFAGARVWFNGYQGSGTVASPQWQLMKDAAQSPVTFDAEATGETVQYRVQAFDSGGSYSDFNSSPGGTVVLSGVVSAPPAPSISQTLTTTPLGYQFSFNQVALGAGVQDVIDSYRIYKNTSANTFAGSSLFHTFVHDPTHLGAIVVQDNVGGGKNYYYFVTSVDTAGLESSATAAQSGAVNSGTASLDTDVSDGSTYARVLASDQTSGHVNRVSDGSTTRTISAISTGLDGNGNLLLKNITNAVGSTSSPTISSATYATIPQMTQTITTKGNPVLILFSGAFSDSATTDSPSIAAFRDGVQVSPDITWTFPALNTQIVVPLTYIDTPSAASHTFDIRWKNNSVATLKAFQAQRSIQVVELG